jgi:PAS domain S-box-containing protein
MNAVPLENSRSRSLRWRILLPLAGLTVIFAGIGFFLLRTLSVEDYCSEIAKRASTIADSIVYAAETASSFDDVQRFVAATGGSPDVGMILVAAGNPARIMASTRHEWIALPVAELPAAGIKKIIEKALQRKSGLARVAGESSSFRYVVPLRTGLTLTVPGHLQQGAVYLEFDDRPYLQERQKMLKVMGGLLGLCVAGIAMGAWLLIWYYILHPLANVRSSMFIRSMGNSRVYAPFMMEGEVGDLARTYNEMLVTYHEGEDRLKAARDNFTSFFNLSVDFLCVLDGSGAFQVANHTLLTRLGYSMDELRGQSVLLIHPPARHAEAGRIVQEMLAGMADVCRVPLQTRDGRLIPVETRIVKGVWDGKPALFGISRDISELVLSEERFSKAFHTGAVMMAISTLRDGRFIDVNQAFLKGLGLSREEVIGHTSSELGLFPSTEVRAAMLKKIGTTGRIFNEEIDFQSRGGEVRHGLFSMDSVEMGEEACILSSMTDITKRKQDERELQEYHRLLEERVEDRTIALRESERISRTLFAHMAQGVVYQDSDGRITMANSAAERILGLTLDQMKGRESLDSRWEAIRENGTLIPPEEYPSLLALKTGRRVPSTVMGVKHPETGALHWILVDAVPEFRPDEAKPCRVFTTFTDMTERKHIESQLIQAQKMESIGRLAGGVAHDFNNSLYCVLGFSELILEKLEANSPLRSDAEQIQQAANQAADVTKQLLAFSRKQVLQPRPTDLDDLILNQQKMLRRIIGEDIRIQLDLKGNSAMAIVDPSQFQQVLMNLCVNARDAMPQGGPLAIASRVVKAPPGVDSTVVKAGASVIKVSITDKGIGMQPEVIDRIFEPFFTTKESGKGTGLGLSVVLGIVKQHGGWVEVASKPGAGTRFDIFLPCDEVMPIAEHEDHTPPPRGNGECILLVEDDPVVRQIGTTRLQKLGYRVIEADSVERGWQRYQTAPDPVRVLLSDVVLPDGSGVTLAERIAAADPSVRIAFSSGYADERSRIMEISARHWPFLTKPYSALVMAKLIDSLLKGGTG